MKEFEQWIIDTGKEWRPALHVVREYMREKNLTGDLSPLPSTPNDELNSRQRKIDGLI